MKMSKARDTICRDIPSGKSFDEGRQWTGVGKVDVAKFDYLMRGTDHPNFGYVLKAPHRSYVCVQKDEDVFKYIAEIEEATGASEADTGRSGVVDLESVTLPQITGMVLLTATVFVVLFGAFQHRSDIFALMVSSPNGASIFYAAFTFMFGILAGLAAGKLVDPIGLMGAIKDSIFDSMRSTGK